MDNIDESYPHANRTPAAQCLTPDGGNPIPSTRADRFETHYSDGLEDGYRSGGQS